MMSLKRLFLGVLSLGVVLGLAGTAGAVLTRSYSLGGSSGGQLQVGGGLPLPIQAECNGVCTNTVFPPLLIGPKGGATVMGTVMVGAKQKLVVPKGVLSKPAAFKILGQFSNNKNLYAVATNLTYTWPNTTATFSTAARTGPTTVTVLGQAAGQSIRYSNVLGRKFGGAAQFALSPGAPPAHPGFPFAGNLNPAAPVTLYAIPPPLRPVGNPPCTHAAFATFTPPLPVPTWVGGDPVGGINVNGFCVAAIAAVLPTGLAAAGGGGVLNPVIVSTPGATATTGLTPNGGFGLGIAPAPGIGVVKAATGAFHPGGPAGSISLFAYTPGGNPGFTNAATSSGFPWTTGMITVKATLATGGSESWMLTGKDARNASGAGVIQMVSGAMSQRTTTFDNANRGWVRLELVALPGVPSMSPVGLAATAGLLLLAAGYVMRRRFSA
jgi:hypothetical protein